MVTHSKLCRRLHELAGWPVPSLRKRWAQAVAAGLLPKARPGPGGAPALTEENAADFLICITAAPTINDTAQAVQVYGRLRQSKFLRVDGRVEVFDPPGKTLREMLGHLIREMRDPKSRDAFERMKVRVHVYQTAPLVEIATEFVDGLQILTFTPAIEAGMQRIALWHKDRIRHPGAPYVVVTLPTALLVGLAELFESTDTVDEHPAPTVREPLSELPDELPLAAKAQ